MIRRLNLEQEKQLFNLLMEDTITNYFILLSLERSIEKDPYEKKWGQFNDRGTLIAGLLKRKTGKYQFYAVQKNYDVEGFLTILKKEGAKKLIGSQSILAPFIMKGYFETVEKGAYISTCKRPIAIKKSETLCRRLQAEDIDRIIPLYERVFPSFTPRDMMVRKIQTGIGRGYYIERDQEIIAVAQTAYETERTAIIVGVGTHPQHRRQGLATQLMLKLMHDLIDEDKRIYLQYNNPIAGNIYKKIGFKDIDRMITLSRA